MFPLVTFPTATGMGPPVPPLPFLPFACGPEDERCDNTNPAPNSMQKTAVQTAQCPKRDLFFIARRPARAQKRSAPSDYEWARFTRPLLNGLWAATPIGILRMRE